VKRIEPQIVEQMREHARQHPEASFPRIALAFGVSLITVKRYCHGRRRAARLFAAGKRSQAEIARELRISRQSVSRWYEAWRQDKPGWIRGAGRAGR
jgi:predicted transcriptional regulator